MHAARATSATSARWQPAGPPSPCCRARIRGLALRRAEAGLELEVGWGAVLIAGDVGPFHPYLPSGAYL
jgi:hypothetical protein